MKYIFVWELSVYHIKEKGICLSKSEHYILSTSDVSRSVEVMRKQSPPGFTKKKKKHGKITYDRIHAVASLFFSVNKNGKIAGKLNHNLVTSEIWSTRWTFRGPLGGGCNIPVLRENEFQIHEGRVFHPIFSLLEIYYTNQYGKYVNNPGFNWKILPLTLQIGNVWSRSSSKYHLSF